MSRDKWLTPETLPADTLCRVLIVPNGMDWLAIVAGALNELCFAYNWEQFGAVTPDQAAAAMVDMFDAFSLNQGVCRVIGEIITWPGSTSPDSKWLLCDGSSLLRADYPDLFAVIGATYGAADGTHFNLPDIRSRSPIGAGTGTGLSTYALGQTGGEETHILTTAELAAHSHTDTGHAHTEITAIPAIGAAITGVPVPSAVPGAGVTGAASANLTSTGSGSGHNNLQPYLALNYLIVALQ